MENQHQMFVKMKMKCFSKRKLNVRISKTKMKCSILGFSQNCYILGKSRKNWSNSAKIQKKFILNEKMQCRRVQDQCRISRQNFQVCGISSSNMTCLKKYLRIAASPFFSSHESEENTRKSYLSSLRMPPELAELYPHPIAGHKVQSCRVKSCGGDREG